MAKSMSLVFQTRLFLRDLFIAVCRRFCDFFEFDYNVNPPCIA